MKKRDWLKTALFLAAAVCFVLLVDRIGNYNRQEESQLVSDAVRRAALTCYAVEGAYPDSLDYLKEHYHLCYDEDNFFVTYDAFASNMPPDIYVVERGADGR